ncbi:MAG TPA: bifunctional glutamate N-acetyltransferase/amino-acid acetyltransferase ArgJ [Dissulfurispiraceae bacterium]|nr:bifunctional glutamate N-acetyltransferase/amino-acid acetyltransferase ArgJ [Dissulfurispiraceae bacterium]
MKKRTPVPKGFRFATAEAAIKKPGRKDLALILSDADAVMAGMFTKNAVKAAPVRLDMNRIKSGKGRAIVINSGNANACTGLQGLKDAEETAQIVGDALSLPGKAVYVCSTGVIGMPMPMDRLRPKLPELAATAGNASFDDVAAAIMTTDTFPKILSMRKKIGGKLVTIAGICKGAGMVAPNMATMLGYIITDAAIGKAALKAVLTAAVKTSFNRITIDGDTSTNDTVLIMANGFAGNAPIKAGTADYTVFATAVANLCYELAMLIVKDGEGATKLIEVVVQNARTEADAEKAAFAIANSMLVKTSIYGNDANWGRLICATGYSGIAVDDSKVDISLNGLMVCKNGMATGRDIEANDRLKSKKVMILINLKLGKGTAKVLTCDLTEGYIKINAEYRT